MRALGAEVQVVEDANGLLFISTGPADNLARMLEVEADLLRLPKQLPESSFLRTCSQAGGVSPAEPFPETRAETLRLLFSESSVESVSGEA